MPLRMATATWFSVRTFSSASVTASSSTARGNDEHALAVAEEKVARRDANAVDRDRAAVVDHLAARRLVLRVGAAAEHGEAQRLDLVGVAHVAVEHRARGLEVDGPRRHQPAPERVAQRRAGRDVDLVLLEIVQRLEEEAERLCRERADRGARRREHIRLEHRHGPADEPHRLVERHDPRRQELVLVAELVEHVADHRGEELAADDLEQRLVVHLAPTRKRSASCLVDRARGFRRAARRDRLAPTNSSRRMPSGSISSRSTLSSSASARPSACSRRRR